MSKRQLPRSVMVASSLVLVAGLAGVLTSLPDDTPRREASDAASVAPAQPERPGTAPGPASRNQPGVSSQADAQARQPSAQTGQAAQSLEGTERNAQDAERSDRTVPTEFAQPLTDIIALLNADRFDEATRLLDELMTAENMAKMTPFGRSRLYQLSFNLNMQAENYEAASADIQAALESGGLDAREFNQMSYQRAQLFVQMEDYAKAADSLELWIADQRAEPNPAAYYLLAASYYYQDKFDDARDHMETMMSMPGEKQEAWYQMMASLYMQDSDYAKAKPVVEKLVELYDDPRYSEQLAGINAELAKSR